MSHFLHFGGVRSQIILLFVQLKQALITAVSQSLSTCSSNVPDKPLGKYLSKREETTHISLPYPVPSSHDVRCGMTRLTSYAVLRRLVVEVTDEGWIEVGTGESG